MAKQISILNPVSRIEGHLKIKIEVDNGKIIDAKSSGTMFRGFELILKDRMPTDAVQITQRICGLCPQSHAIASSMGLEEAYNVKTPENAIIVRNLLLGSNFLMNHITHFYQLAALDYVKGPDNSPYVPRADIDYRLSKSANDAIFNHYIKALKVRSLCQEMSAIFGGKMPHSMTCVPGGVTSSVSSDKIISFLYRLKDVLYFINNVYIPDLTTISEAYKDYFDIGVGYKNFLCFDVFKNPNKGEKSLFSKGTYINGNDDKLNLNYIKEFVKNAWYKNDTTDLNPENGITTPEVDKKDAYSFIKAPRYEDNPCEVGPLARMWINNYYRKGVSVMDRHIARALESKKIAKALESWIIQLKPDEKICNHFEIPKKAEGTGLIEAPRGALGHWIKIDDSKIKNYQVITPTNWNFSPKDDSNINGPLEKALIDTEVKDSQNHIEAQRIIRSFDPCMACAVH